LLLKFSAADGSWYEWQKRKHHLPSALVLGGRLELKLPANVTFRLTFVQVYANVTHLLAVV